MATNESYKPDVLRKLKDIELYILSSVNKCCEELNITYFIAYGTALGAVRHGGFIPWDDDIDIGMMRKDYEVFLSRGNDILKSYGLFLQDITTESTCPFPWAKVRMNNTVFVEYCNRNVKAHQGVYIDVFPFDELPKEISEQKRQHQRVQQLTKLFVLHQTPDITEKPQDFKGYLKSVIRRSVYYILRIIPISFISSQIRHYMTEYNGCNSDIFGCQFYPKFKAGYITKSMITNLRPINFEDVSTYVMGDVESYLSAQYGDYLKLPPIEQRIGHRPFKVII